LLRGRRGYLVFLLLVMSLVIPIPYVSGIVWWPWSSQDEIVFPLRVEVRAPGGWDERFFKVFVYRLDEDTTRFITACMAEGGLAEITLRVKKVEYLPLRSKGNLEFVVYRTINFRVVVFGADGTGELLLPIDPAEIERKGKESVVIHEIPYPNGITLTRGELETLDEGVPEEQDETYELTHIVTFHSWDGLDSSFEALPGSKMAVAEKRRISYWIWGEPNIVIGEWHESGRVSVVTMEVGRAFPGEGYVSGRKRYEVWFQLKYRYERWRYEIPGLTDWREYVNVIDTSLDPRGMVIKPSSEGGDPLPGNGVSDPWNHGDSVWGAQNSIMSVPIKGHGGEKLRWSVSVGFGVQWPKGVGVSVSLSVWKEYQDPSPMRVYVLIHSHPNPGYVGWAYDRNTGWMKIYLTWASHD